MLQYQYGIEIMSLAAAVRAALLAAAVRVALRAST